MDLVRFMLNMCRYCCCLKGGGSNHSDLDVSMVKEGESNGAVEAGNRSKKRGRKPMKNHQIV